MRIIIAIAAVTISLASVLNVQHEMAPYLYYFSEERSAFIVEQADGSASRVLADYAPTPESGGIGGPGWSPSGDRFAWVDGQRMAYLADTGTAEVFPLENIPNLLWGVTWSPQSDLLLIGEVLYLGSIEEVYTFHIVEVATENQLSEFSPQNSNFRGIRWTPAEQLALNEETDDPASNRVSMISVDDTRESISVFAGNLCGKRARDWIWFGRAFSAYVHPDGEQLIVLDSEFNQIEAVQLDNPNILSLEWNPADAYAVLYSVTCSDEATNQAWLLDGREGMLHLLGEDVGIPDAGNTIWLQRFPSYSWSSDGRLLAIANQETIQVVDPETRLSQTIVPAEPEYTLHHFNLISWSPNGDEIATVWVSDDYYMLHIYNLSNNGGTSVELNGRVGNIAYSPDGQFLAVSWFDDDAGVSKVSMVTRQNTEIEIQDIFVSELDGFAELEWHMTQNWLLIGEQIAGSLMDVSVVNTDGSVLRNLGYCYNTVACFGWLPAETPFN